LQLQRKPGRPKPRCSKPVQNINNSVPIIQKLI
jgi:hypothetical protein